MNPGFLFFVVIFQLVFCSLPKHEILTSESIKRNYRFGSLVLESIELDLLGEHFNIKLTLGRPPLSKNIKIATDSSILRYSDLAGYEGYKSDDPSITATLHELEPGVFIGFLNTGNDTIFIEPADIHLKNVLKSDMIVYRGSDWLESPRSESVLLYKQKNMKRYAPSSSDAINPFTKYRKKRQDQSTGVPVKKNRCGVKVVADYDYFQRVGRSDAARVSKYIIKFIAQVNKIFTRTDFDQFTTNQEDNPITERFVNVGMQIEAMVIHNTPSNDSNHFNFSGKVWNSTDLLNAFSQSEMWNDYCLRHLITGKQLADDGVLGCAFEGKAPNFGICGKYNTQNNITNQNVLLTVGFISGLPLLSRETEIVAAHEYGHAWGASHDGDVCKNTLVKEKYIMAPRAVSGLKQTHDKFSNCSIAQIGKFLHNRASCFKEERSSYCGNGVVELNEDCDGTEYKCCTSDCRFTNGSVCSPYNHPCCTADCTFHNAEHECAPRAQLECLAASTCNGRSRECPIPEKLHNFEECADQGVCVNGKCIEFCRHRKLKHCLCEKAENACRRCCRKDNGTCEPYDDFKLSDNDKCITGYCENNICVSITVRGKKSSSTLGLSGEDYQMYQTMIILGAFTVVFLFCCYLIIREDRLLM